MPPLERMPIFTLSKKEKSKMGIYTEYLNKNMTPLVMEAERKRLLTLISSLRGNRDVLVYASDASKSEAPIGIDNADLLPFQDQLSNLKGKDIDIIIDTPGGLAEVVEDMVKLVRGKHNHVGIIVPGSAKSAGTIFAMAADEILMGPASSLGPIDAQIMMGSKRFSAEAFLEGLEKIKKEVIKNGLNLAYVPILQNISPGEIQHCENAQSFSQTLVSKWLEKYKFSTWVKHSSSGAPVTQQEKIDKAKDIAARLCNHSNWLTHGRSIKIGDLTSMGLLITDYSANIQLNDAITRYYTLLRMTFDSSPAVYKIFETATSQILKQFVQMQQVSGPVPFGGPIPLGTPLPAGSPAQLQQAKKVNINVNCVKCGTGQSVQGNLEPNIPYEKGQVPYPIENDIIKCVNCGTDLNLRDARVNIEAQTGKKIVK